MIRRISYYLLSAVFVAGMSACGSNAHDGHDHADHEHAAHDHEHDHEHSEAEGHDHEAELAGKEAKGAHADEIILSAEKARAAGVKVEEVKPRHTSTIAAGVKCIFSLF